MDSANAKTFYFTACFSLLTNLLCLHMKVSFFLFASVIWSMFSFLLFLKIGLPGNRTAMGPVFKIVGLQPPVIASRAPHLLLEQSVMTQSVMTQSVMTLRFEESWTCIARQFLKSNLHLLGMKLKLRFYSVVLLNGYTLFSSGLCRINFTKPTGYRIEI